MPAFLLLAVCAVVAVLWMRRGTGDGDVPARLVAAAVPKLPAHRREWGQAMLAELTQVHGRARRSRFAAGVLRVVLFPPLRHRGRLMMIAAVGVLVGAAATVAAARQVRSLSVFIATLSLLLAGYATVVATRSPRLRWTAPYVLTGAIAVAAAGATVTTLVRVAVTHPAATADNAHVFSVSFALLLTGYLGFALTPPRLGDRTATPLWWALAATLTSCGIWALTALATPATTEGTTALLSPVAAAATLTAALGASATTTDRATGIRAGLLTVALGAPLHFAAGVTALLRPRHYTLTNPYDIAAFPRSGYPDAASYLLSDAITGAIITGFVLYPIVLGALAVLAATAGTRLRQLTGKGNTHASDTSPGQ